MFDAREFRRSLAAFATGVAIVTSSSLAAFARAKYVAINVLTADQRELSTFTACRSESPPARARSVEGDARLLLKRRPN